MNKPGTPDNAKTRVAEFWQLKHTVNQVEAPVEQLTCDHCGETRVECKEDCPPGMLHDPCLGHLKRAYDACCGHGRQQGYIRWLDQQEENH